MDELIAILKHMIDTCETAFASIDECHDKAVHLATIDPDLSSSIAELHRNYEQFESVRITMRHFMMNPMGELFADAFYANVVIEEHNTAAPEETEEPNTTAPKEADEPNTAAPEETEEPNTAAPEETEEPNTAAPEEAEEPNTATPEGTTEPNRAAPGEMVEYNTAASEVSVEDNWHQNALDLNKKD